MIWQRLKAMFGLDGGGVRATLAGIAASVGLEGGRCPTEAHQRSAFTIAFVALAAKMAKADGVAVAAELEAFERWFKVPADQRDSVRRVFDAAKRDIAGYESYARQIASLLAEEPELKRDVFECLFHIASADGVLHEDEEHFLRRVADVFGLDAAAYAQVRRVFIVDEDDPYAILGADSAMSDAALKAHYRQLAKENHSDRLAAHGVPREFQSVADRKLATINAAYDAIVKERAALNRAIEEAEASAANRGGAGRGPGE
ncbi:MAG: TerB family tellurite resistance protein [Hyphomicrobiaceae bacterium]|nr:TerB family tellurite resistance protein [Hyphomicrobiaceae bacterium]